MADRILKPDSGNDLVLQNDDASAKIEINEAGTIVHTGTSSIDVSGGTFTTSSAQKQAIVQAGPGSGTLDVSSGTFTTSSAQKQAIVQAGPGSGTLDVSSGTFTTSSAQKQAIVDGATIEAQDLASGSGTTLPNNVQDAITRLGTVTSGTFNGTIGGSATFQSGFLVNAFYEKHTGGNMDIVSETLTAAFDYRQISCTVGNTIVFGFTFQFEAFRTTGDATNRKGKIQLYHSTSAVSANATSSLGTLVFNSQAGRTLTGNSGQAASSFDAINVFGVFEATATTHYLGLARAGSHDPNVLVRIYRTSTNPLYFYFHEFKGDIFS